MLTVAILSGGLATRLKPLSDVIPKALVPVNGRPFIEWQLEYLKNQGFEHVVICIGYLGNQIVDAIGGGSTFGLDVEYSLDGGKLLGTGGAIKKALTKLGDAFFVLYGDSYLPIDFKLVERAYQSGEHCLMTVYRNEGKWDKSNVEFRDGRIIAYDKENCTESMLYIDYGLSILSRNAFCELRSIESFDLSVVFNSLLQKQLLKGYEITSRFFEVGSMDGIKALESHLRDK